MYLAIRSEESRRIHLRMMLYILPATCRILLNNLCVFFERAAMSPHVLMDIFGPVIYINSKVFNIFR